MVDNFIVAIDGTAAAGKSTTARLAAQELGYFYLDTGAMYRAITLKLLNSGMDPNNPFSDPKLKRILISTRLECHSNRWWLDGQDVTQSLRGPQVDRTVSQVSALKAVREWMRDAQRRIASSHPYLICEGRDMGSVVFPNAQLKVFIDAELSERARRRHHELAEQGLKLPISKVKENLQFRDRYDSSRRYSPLRIPDHAVRLDTTRLSIADEVAALVKLIRERLK